MKSVLNYTAILLTITVCSCSVMGQTTQDQQKAFMNYMTPGPVHEWMAKSAGDWKVDMKFWMDPTQPAIQSTASCTNKMILGGRYLESRNTGDVMGMPFEGIGTTGYDNAKKVFMSSWVDNMGTGIMYMEGIYDPKTKSITFTGTTVDPMTGKDMKIKQTQEFPDDNTMTMEMYTEQNGKELKTMELKFTRK